MNRVCAPCYLGRKRGEVGRTRTAILQAHTHQFLGTFGGAGNGEYRGELKRALQAIASHASKLSLPHAHILVRLDGVYGNAAPLTDVLTSGLGVSARDKDYTLLDLPEVKVVLSRLPDQQSTHPQSGISRALYDCPAVPLTPSGPYLRLIVATHPASSTPPSLGVERSGQVYELFVATLPSAAFTPKDVLDLYLHRRSFETVLADEDTQQDPDRCCSRTPCGQACWQILSQWMGNLRLELGEPQSPTAMRTTEFAAALQAPPVPTIPPPPPETPPAPAKGRIVCYMPLASAIVAAVPCVPSVKKAFPLPNRDGSVRFSGLVFVE